jgi:predicted ribosome quality control (RQC) complex YloA/Tae2 family protein
LLPLFYFSLPAGCIKVCKGRLILVSMVKGKPTRRDHQLRLVEYLLPGRWKALVGRTDLDNDYLSLKVARPDDWWLHVRGVPGGHVILQGPAGEEPDRETLKRAAAIAAYHSKARKAGLVAVSCTRARYVTKPRGAKTGTVQIRKEVMLKVRPGAGEELAKHGK